MSKKQRLKQIEYRMMNGIGSMSENVDQYAERLLLINNLKWLSFIIIAITITVVLTNN